MKKVIVTAVLMLGVLVLGVVSMPWWRYEVETFRGVSIRYDRLTGQMQEWDGESHRWTLKNW